MAALPINRPSKWLLAAQVPWFLSFRVAEERNLINYVSSLYKMYMTKAGPKEQEIKKIAERLHGTLRDLVAVINENSKAMEKDNVPYWVMDPPSPAVSILIWRFLQRCGHVVALAYDCVYSKDTCFPQTKAPTQAQRSS